VKMWITLSLREYALIYCGYDQLSPDISGFQAFSPSA
jgi:hypothetical protein